MAAFIALYRVVLKHQITRGRLVLFAAVAIIAIGIAWLNRGDAAINRPATLIDATEFMDVFGLGLVAPVIALVLGSAALGNMQDDETMVYIWLRPVSRWIIAAAATAAAATVALPAVVVPMTISAAIGSGGDNDLILATATAMALATLAYTSLFVLVGLVIRRSLVWGLVYVFIWELVVARFLSGAARLSINSYAKNVLVKISNVEIDLLATNRDFVAFGVPLMIVVAAAGLTTWRLSEANVA